MKAESIKYADGCGKYGMKKNEDGFSGCWNENQDILMLSLEEVKKKDYGVGSE